MRAVGSMLGRRGHWGGWRVWKLCDWQAPHPHSGWHLWESSAAHHRTKIEWPNWFSKDCVHPYMYLPWCRRRWRLCVTFGRNKLTEKQKALGHRWERQSLWRSTHPHPTSILYSQSLHTLKTTQRANKSPHWSLALTSKVQCPLAGRELCTCWSEDLQWGQILSQWLKHQSHVKRGRIMFEYLMDAFMRS